MKKIEIAKKVTARIALAFVLLAVLGALISGCAPATGSSVTVDGEKLGYDENVNTLSKTELKSVAELLAGNGEAHAAFLAAYRGYDVTVDDFDFEAERPALAPSTEFAVRVIEKYDAKDSLSKEDYEKLSVADMESVIGALKTEIEIEGQRDIFATLQYWIGVAVGAITNTVGFGHYLVGICEFAIIIEILMLPFSIKQQKNSIRQAKLRPKEMAIRNKYKGRNDQATQQKVQQEIQDLYTRENFNPMSGCLPLLIQLPILIILYNIIVDPVRYVLGFSAEYSTALKTYFTTCKAAGGLGQVLTSKNGTIEILSMVKEQGTGAFEGLRNFLAYSNGGECFDKLSGIGDTIPNFGIGSLNFGLTPSFDHLSNFLWIIPLLTFAVYFFSMKLTRKFSYQPTTGANDQQTGCSNNIMDISMPLMSTFIAFGVPALLGVYWIFRSILSTVKQFIMSRVMPLPVFTEEDYKAAEKEMKSKSKNSPKRSSSDGTKPRSLHHIDDDDEPYPVLPKRSEPDEKPESEEKTEEKAEEKPEDTPADSSRIEAAPLKDDSDKPKTE